MALPVHPEGGAGPAPTGAGDGVTAAHRIDAASDQLSFHERGSPAYTRVNLALFGAGFSTFSLLYCVQPLMPLFSEEFGVGAAAASLALSLSTGLLALAIFMAGSLADGRSRKSVMTTSLFASAALNLACAFAPDWHLLLVLRALEGVALGGVPAVGMAYLAEEMHPRSLGASMGLYIAGNAFGGMSGRVITGVLTDLFGWRVGVAGIAILGLATSIAFVTLLPPSRHHTPGRGSSARVQMRMFGRHLSHPGLPWLFGVGFLAMGAFVTVYNYAGYRLSQPPFWLSQTAIGLIFVVYLFGMAASATFGRLADRIGRGPVLLSAIAVSAVGLGLTLGNSLLPVVAGISLVTIGFFGTHSVASGWVGRMARTGKGQASSLYLLAYYLGSSVMGSLGGVFWANGGWPSVVVFVAVLIVLLGGAGLRLVSLDRATSLHGDENITGDF